MGLTNLKTKDIFKKEVIGNVRKAQEDSHDYRLDTPNGHVFVVCDGMGGHVGGKQASTIAVNSILEYLEKGKYEDPEKALVEALDFANMQILGYAEKHPELKGMGTTACIVLLQEDDAYIAHVGDSRIYLYLEKEKELRRITKDHSFVQALVDAGEITDDEAEHHPMKNRILKALGVKSDMIPDTRHVLPKIGDTFLVCSDGLCGMISDSTMKAVLDTDAAIKDKGDELVNQALGAGGLDNITLELIRISDSKHLKTDDNFKQKKISSSEPQSLSMAMERESGQKSATEKKNLKWILASVACFVVVAGLIGYPKFYFNSVTKRAENALAASEGYINNCNEKIQRLNEVIEDSEGAFNELNKNSADEAGDVSNSLQNMVKDAQEWKSKIESLENQYKEKRSNLKAALECSKNLKWSAIKELESVITDIENHTKKIDTSLGEAEKFVKKNKIR